MEVVWTTAALEELEQIQDFVALESPAAAYKLANALIERASMVLSNHPLGADGLAEPRERASCL